MQLYFSARTTQSDGCSIRLESAVCCSEAARYVDRWNLSDAWNLISRGCGDRPLALSPLWFHSAKRSHPTILRYVSTVAAFDYLVRTVGDRAKDLPPQRRYIWVGYINSKPATRAGSEFMAGGLGLLAAVAARPSGRLRRSSALRALSRT